MKRTLHLSRRRFGQGATSFAIACSFLGGAAAQSEAMDAVYVNGKVVTVDGSFSIAEAFAIRGNRFSAVGSNASISKLATANTRVIDLAGKAVVPGFVDAHPHFGPEPQVSIEGLKSVSEILQRISEAAAKLPAGSWIVTSPIGELPEQFNLPDTLIEGRWPTKAELDKAAPRNPLFIPGPHQWPYPSLFNSAALARLDVANAADDAFVKIDRTANGEPSGQIHGLVGYYRRSPLFQKLVAVLPKTDPEAELNGLKNGLAEYVRFGVTSLYAAHALSSQHKFRELVQQVRAMGQAVPRVVHAYEIPRGMSSLAAIDQWMTTVPEAKASGSGDDMFKTVGVTVSLDGATQWGMALMNEPYLDPYGQLRNGASAFSTEQLIEVARLALKHDLRLNIQAAGNKACAMTVEALEAVHRETPINGKRWVVQHFQHPTREQIAKMRGMGIAAQTYSAVDFSKGADTYVRRFSGKQRDLWKSTVPLRWWIDGGIKVAQSTDGLHKNPAFTIWESLVRLDGRTGKSLLTPEKTINVREAIEIYTINGAYVMQWEDRIGSIEAGKFADFVVFDRDLLTIPTDEIRHAKVVQTSIDGKVVYGQI